MTSTPAARAAVISGRVGTPGDITTRSAVVKVCASWPPSCQRTGTPASWAIGPASWAAGLPSVTTTRAPRRAQNRATAMPVWARPTTTTVLPRRSGDAAPVIVASPELEGAEREQREQQRHQPEPDDDLGLVPALLLVVVVDRRHREHPLAGAGQPLGDLE